MMNPDSQTKLNTVNTGEHETVMLVDTFITKSELNTLCDSAFAYTNSDNENISTNNSTILSALQTRIQDCSHYYNDKSIQGDDAYHLRCAITDKEMELLNSANKTMNPLSSSAVITRIQNSVEPIMQKLYHIEINIPLSFKEEFSCHDKLSVLSDNTSFNVLGFKDVKPRYKLNTYITQEEYDALMNISNNDKYSEDIRNFCEVIPQVTQEFCFETEREEYLENIN